MNSLKANKSDSSGSLVLSFESKWEPLLIDGSVSVVFRKKGPASIQLDYLYIYVGLPTSAIIGRAKIKNYAIVDVRQALAMAPEGKISEAELKEYAGRHVALGVFSLGEFEPAEKRLTMAELAESFGFKPPQRFFYLSKDGKVKLDSAAKF